MVKTTILRGYSDDIISLKGNISEEFYSIDDEQTRVIMLDDSTIFSVDYSSTGIWRFNIKNVGSKYTYTKHEATGEEDENGDEDYSDIITIEGDVKFIVYGKLAKYKG